MYPKEHIILGAVFSILIFIIFPQISITAAAIIFLSSFLIDIDHYLYYLIKKKDFSLSRAYNWHIQREKKYRSLSYKEKQKVKLDIMLFHGIEFYLLIFILVFVHKIFFYVLIGIAFHMILDFMDMLHHNIPLYVKSSQIYLCITNKNKREF